ncbi:MAG: AraC family transcriptional regulator [Deltaproteobacteria bacterium]|nr:AraC family transcriptional regulator [Deltaproteobacteria bacterium]
MEKEIRTSYTASQILMEIILDHGMPLAEFEKQTGVNPSRIKDPDAWIPMTSFVRLWELAVDATGDHALALRLRKDTGIRMVHFAIQLALHSRTMLDALFHFTRYNKVIAETDKFEIADKDELVEVTYTNTSPYQVRWLPEHHFSFGVELGRSLAKENYNPIRVSFQHADPGYKEVYEDVFRAPVFFQQPKNSIVSRKKDFLQPIAARDPYLQSVLEKYAEELMSKRGKSVSVQEKVKEYIFTNLSVGEINLETAASALNMARSTLYRQLKMEETSFRDLLLKTRQDLAKAHLREGMTNSQVAYLIGFSEPSAFHRAFKRWYNISPGEYRKSIQGSRS